MDIVRGFGATTQRHARATVTFSNSSGTVTVFTTTGRVLVIGLVSFCTDTLVEDGAVSSIELGGATNPDAFIVQTDPAAIQTDKWWANATPVGGVEQIDPLQIDVMTDEDIILTITGGVDIDSGTIIFDVWYLQITDTGGLT